MIPRIAAKPSPSIKHTTTADDLSVRGNPSVSLTPITDVKTRFLSIKIKQAIQKIANDSIQNKEKMDSLARSVHLAELGIQALKEENSLQDQGNKNENPLKPILREIIAGLTKEEKSVRDDISNLSKEMQILEKKQQEQADAATKRTNEFNRHYGVYKKLLKEASALRTKKGILDAQHHALQDGIHEKTYDIQNMALALKSKDDSIKKAVEGKISAIYEEMMKATPLFKQHGVQSISEITITELTEYLCKMTYQSKLRPEQIKYIEDKTKKQNMHMNISFGVFIAVPAIAFMKNVFPLLKKLYQLSNAYAQAQENSDERIRISAQYNLASKEHSQEFFKLVILSTALIIPFIFFRKRQDKTEKESENLKKHNPLQRILKQEFINSAKSEEEDIFKFAFSMVNYANMKLLKNPIETMTAEVTKLVTNARKNHETLIDINTIDKKNINEYFGRFKESLQKKRVRLEEKLDTAIANFISQQRREGVVHIVNEPCALSVKADFVKQYMLSNETKAARDLVDKSIFINELIQVFSGSNEDALTDAIRNMIANVSQEMIDKLSASDAGSSDMTASPFERRIKDAEQEKYTLKETLEQVNTELGAIGQEKEKIEKDISGVAEEIGDKERAMNTCAKNMETLRFSENQLKAFKDKLSNSGIPVTLKGEHEGYSREKIKNIDAQQREDNKKLESLLEKHDQLYEHYAILQRRIKQNKDQLEKIEFLEATNRSDKDAKIKKIENDIKTYQKKINELASKESDLVNNLDKVDHLKDILTLKAINGAKSRHLKQSDRNLQSHAVVKGYSSNYRSVGHFLQACLDTHAALQKNIEECGVPSLKNYFVKSDMDIADGMDNKNFQNVPISASVSDIKEEIRHGEKQYRIDHIYGYVPRGSDTQK